MNPRALAEVEDRCIPFRPAENMPRRQADYSLVIAQCNGGGRAMLCRLRLRRICKCDMKRVDKYAGKTCRKYAGWFEPNDSVHPKFMTLFAHE